MPKKIPGMMRTKRSLSRSTKVIASTPTAKANSRTRLRSGSRSKPRLPQSTTTATLYAGVASRVTGRTIIEDSEDRNLWNVVFLSIINGQGVPGIARKIGCQVEQAKDYIGKFADAHPDVLGILALRGLELALTRPLLPAMGGS